jgi:hypothetical protein
MSSFSSMHASAPANVPAGCSGLRDSGGRGDERRLNEFVAANEPTARNQIREFGVDDARRTKRPGSRVFRARAGVPRLVLVEAREVHVVEVEVDEIGDVMRVLGAAREGGTSAKGGGGGAAR